MQLSDTEKSLLDQLPNAVVVADMQGLVQYLNPIAASFFNKRVADAIGMPIDSLILLTDEQTLEPITTPGFYSISEGIAEDAGNNALLINTDDATNKLPVDVTSAPFKNPSGEQLGIIINLHDVRLSRFSRRQLAWQAERDALTGLFNLSAFEQYGVDRLNNSDSQYNALLWIEVDHFEQLVTLCGKAQVDDLLVQLAETLVYVLPETSILARHSDNIFLLLLIDADLVVTTGIANTILQTIAGISLFVGHEPWVVSASSGITAFENLDDHRLGVLIHQAHQACHHAKQAGGNQLYISMQEQQTRYEQQIARFQRGMDQNEFHLFFQQIISVQKNQLPSCEILLRHQCSITQEETSPSVFMPLCERSGLIRHLDRWVISQIQDLLLFDPKLTERFDKIHINLSDYSLNCPFFMEEVQTLLSHHLLPPGKLCFEISQHHIEKNQPNTIHFIRQLSALGCRFCLDDVDGNLTVFHHLQHLPIYMIKIDPTLSVRATWQEHAAIMVKALVDIAHSLKIQVVLQHIERPEMIETIGQITEADFLQGFALHSPEPLSHLMEM
jgi:diguanylate cyclase (GGDEF)-like protein